MSSSTDKKKNLLKTIFTRNARCGGCGKQKLSDVYEPTPPPPKFSNKKAIINPSDRSSSTIFSSEKYSNEDQSSSTTTTSSKQNSESETDQKYPSDSTMMVFSSPCPKIVDSVAVVKDSNDPYQDFRHSMLQMVREKEIYSKDDLQQLLNCFLELNSTCYHDIILRAFTDIWNQAISKRFEESHNKPCVHGKEEDDPSHA